MELLVAGEPSLPAKVAECRTMLWIKISLKDLPLKPVYVTGKHPHWSHRHYRPDEPTQPTVQETPPPDLVEIVPPPAELEAKAFKPINVTLKSIDDLARLAGFLTYYPQEHTLVFYLKHGRRGWKVLEGEIVSKGTLNAALSQPREILRNAILTDADGIVIAHNHPSGDPTPSFEDKATMAELRNIARLWGIMLVDWLVIGHTKYYSGRLDATYYLPEDIKEIKLKEWRLRHKKEHDQVGVVGKEVTYPTALFEVAMAARYFVKWQLDDELRKKVENAHMVMLIPHDTRGRVLGCFLLDIGDGEPKPETLRDQLRKAAKLLYQVNAAGFFVTIHKPPTDQPADPDKLLSELHAYEIKLLDLKEAFKAINMPLTDLMLLQPIAEGDQPVERVQYASSVKMSAELGEYPK